MNIILVVTHAFGAYAKGTHITDADTIASVLASEHAAHVVRVQAPSASSAQEH